MSLANSDRPTDGQMDGHALSGLSYVNVNAAASPLPLQACPTSWEHIPMYIKIFCWENFEKWPGIGVFSKNLMKTPSIIIFLVSNLVRESNNAQKYK